MREWCEKIRHKSEESAKEHAARLNLVAETSFDKMEWYPCGSCKGWHVGHATPKWRRDMFRGASIAIQKALTRNEVELPAQVVFELSLVAMSFAKQGYKKALNGESFAGDYADQRKGDGE